MMKLPKFVFFCLPAAAFFQSCKVAPDTQYSKSLARLSQCAAEAFSAVQRAWPSVRLNPDDYETALEMDCKETSKLKNISEPVITSNSAMDSVTKLVAKIPNGFVKDSVTILKPYCRSDNELYGPFCMAADVDSAFALSQDKELLALLPQAVHDIGTEIANQSDIDFYAILNRTLPAGLRDRNERVVLLAAFLGLDDNAVQADRLKANLLFEKRFEEYAKVFPALTQYATFPPQNGNDYSKDFLALLFSTRTGIATLSGVAEGETQTYKAYAGLYLGCRMAQLGRSAALTENEAFSMGYAYQMTKLGARLRKPLNQLIADAKKLDAHGKRTGEKMKAGARFGYKICAPAGSQ
ncbi:MAG: hypothetical protein EBR09_14760 [Proteobacteria bacterium]|nr:hypothetical protein [Pseudomonadota bacterium]